MAASEMLDLIFARYLSRVLMAFYDVKTKNEVTFIYILMKNEEPFIMFEPFI